jgi:hypothetical protein
MPFQWSCNPFALKSNLEGAGVFSSSSGVPFAACATATGIRAQRQQSPAKRMRFMIDP